MKTRPDKGNIDRYRRLQAQDLADEAYITKKLATQEVLQPEDTGLVGMTGLDGEPVDVHSLSIIEARPTIAEVLDRLRYGR